MRRFITFFTMLALVAAWSPAFAETDAENPNGPRPGDGKWHEGVLFPGESHTFESVTATWKVGGEAPEGALLSPKFGDTKDVGWLSFEIDGKWRLSVSAPLKVEQNSQKIRVNNVRTVYIANTMWRFSGQGAYVGVDTRLEMRVMRQPSEIELDASPQSMDLYVSKINPVTLGRWTISVSDQKKAFPDGSQRLQIIVAQADKEPASLPATVRAVRRFGRLILTVERVDEPTRTVSLQVRIDQDDTARGRHSFIYLKADRSTPLTDFLENAANVGRFEVEWLPSPEDRPESVDFLKNVRAAGSISTKGIAEPLLSDYLRRYFKDVDHEWVDDTHLRVWSTGYASHIAQQEAKARQRELAKAEAAEKARELKEMKERFGEDYQTSTRVFGLSRVSPVAAKVFVDLQLRDYGLVPSDKAPQKAQVELRGGRNAIVSIPTGENDKWLKETSVVYSREQAIDDSRGNNLIVSATPQTMERVEQLLFQLEQAPPLKQMIATPSRHRVEVILLEGRRAVEVDGVVRPVDVQPLSVLVGGTVVDIPVKKGQSVKKGETLLRLDSSDLKLDVKKIQAQLEANHATVESLEQLAEGAKTRHAAGIISTDEVTKVEVELKQKQAEQAGLEVDYERSLNHLRRLEVTAPTDGKVEAVNVAKGKPVKAGETVAFFLSFEGESRGRTPRPELARRSTSLRATAPAKGAHAGGVAAEAATVDAPTAGKEFGSQLGRDARRGYEDFAGGDEFGKEAKPTIEEKYGIKKKDLELLGLTEVTELGRGVIDLIGERGETGQATLLVADDYSCRIEFVDVRKPYLVIKSALEGAEKKQTLIENTLFLEPGKPSLLGLTNLREALILVIQQSEEPMATAMEAGSAEETP